MTGRMIAGSAVLVAGLLYGPHVWWGEWVYEDAAMLSVVGSAPLWQPRGLTRGLWWLQAQWMVAPHVWHGVSLLLHGLVAGETGWLARRLGLSSVSAAIAGGVVLLHPLGVEAVAYAAQQGELIATIGVLGACVLAAGRWWRWPVVVGIIACLAISIGGKESGVVVLGLVPLVMWHRAPYWWRERPAWAATWLPAVIAGELLAGGLLHYGWTIVNIGESAGVSVSAREWLLVQSTAAMRTLGLLVLPLGPYAVDYDYDLVPMAMRWVSVLSLGALTWGAWQVRRRWPLITLSVTWCLIVLVPRLIIQTPRGYLNDHQAYLLVPALGLCIGALWERMRCRQP